MEKYKFEKKLKEAVFIKKDSKTTAMVLNGEEVEVCCPELCSSIIETGCHCLVFENRASEDEKYSVAAFSLDNPNRKNKDWICLKPAIFEDAVDFFLAGNQMEEMISGCKAGKKIKGRRDAETPFFIEDSCIQISVPEAVLNPANDGWFQIRPLFLTAKKIEKYKNLIAHFKKARMIFLTIFQHGLNDKMQDWLCRELSHFFGIYMDENTEFWVADMKLEADGIALISYQNITERVLLE